MKKFKVNIDAIIDRDLLIIINEFGLLDSLNKGNLNCPHCGRKITFENIGGIKPNENSIVIICDDTACLIDATTK